MSDALLPCPVCGNVAVDLDNITREVRCISAQDVCAFHTRLDWWQALPRRSAWVSVDEPPKPDTKAIVKCRPDAEGERDTVECYYSARQKEWRTDLRYGSRAVPDAEFYIELPPVPEPPEEE